MKILVLANNDTGLYIFRGKLLSELVRMGHDVIAVTPIEDRADDLLSLGIRLVSSNLDRRGINPLSDIALLKQYLELIQKESPALIISYTIKPNVYGGIAARIKKIPYASNITGLGTAFEKPGLVKTAAVVLNKVALKRAKVVFFENEADRIFFVNGKIIRPFQAKVLMGAGVDLEFFTYLPYPRDEEFRFLFIGRVMKEKGIDELLEAMDILHKRGYKCVLDIVGGLEEDYLDTIRLYEAKGYVKYHGKSSDVREFIASAHCFVLPSWHEGMANTNLESAASGRPVITSNIPGCRESVVEGKTGFLAKARDTKSLCEKMSKMMDLTHETREQMGINGRKHMKDVFDKDKVVEETINSLF